MRNNYGQIVILGISRYLNKRDVQEFQGFLLKNITNFNDFSVTYLESGHKTTGCVWIHYNHLKKSFAAKFVYLDSHYDIGKVEIMQEHAYVSGIY